MLRFTHTLKLFWHEAAHPVWTILYFGMGVKLPAKLIVAEDKRIIAAGTSGVWLRMTDARQQFNAAGHIARESGGSPGAIV
jgi:hypothetical protein